MISDGTKSIVRLQKRAALRCWQFDNVAILVDLLLDLMQDFVAVNCKIFAVNS